MKKDLLHPSHSTSLEAPKWKIAMDKVNAAEVGTKEYYLANAEYYDALISSNGDDNGYYYRMMQSYLKKAKELETNSL